MFETSELFNLLGDILSLPILVVLVFRTGLPRYPLFLCGIGAIVASHVFTIVEGTALPDMFNTAEHISILVASVFFLWGVLRNFSSSVGDSR